MRVEGLGFRDIRLYYESQHVICVYIFQKYERERESMPFWVYFACRLAVIASYLLKSLKEKKEFEPNRKLKHIRVV